MMFAVKDELLMLVDKLTPEQQAHLLDIARQMQTTRLPPGTSGTMLIAHQSDFRFDPGAIDDMMQIIENGCEGIDQDGWK